MLSRLKKTKISSSLIFPTLLTLLLFILAFCFFIIPNFEKNLKSQKKQSIRNLTDAAWNILDHYYQESIQGKISEKRAQSIVKNTIRALHYGHSQKDYFWIHTIENPILLVHPYLQNLEGKPISSFPAKIKTLFENYLKIVETKSSGFIEYDWQWHEDEKTILPKISYIKRFDPWHWVIGTGTYMHDLQSDIKSQLYHFIYLSLIIFVFILLILFFILHQNLKMKRNQLKYQEELQENEEKFRLIIEHSFDVIWTADLNLNFTFISPSVEKLMGYTPEECMAYGPARTLTPLSLLTVQKVFQEEMEKEMEKPGTAGNRTMVLEQNHKSGTTVWTEVVTSFIRKNNQIVGISGTTRDITQKRKAEHALFESEQLFKSLIEYGADMIMLISPEGLIQYASPSFKNILGFRPEELIGENIWDIIYPEDIHLARELIESTIDHSDEFSEGEIRILNKQSEIKTLYFTSKSLVSHTSLNGVVINARDITDKKSAEEKLQQQTEALTRSNHELEQFAYITSHDLKQPLHTILGFTELLKMQCTKDLNSESQEYLNYIIQGAKRMNQLIDDLLQYSRVTTHQKPFSQTDLNDTLKQVKQDLFAIIQEKKPQLNIPDCPTILCDASQIERLFQNLISNALKFNDKSIPVIELEIEEEPQHWLFKLKDNGIGIDSLYIQNIFQIFKRAHTKEGYSGSGIGLAICEKIVHRHKGKISVTSQVGEGSIFTFTIAKNP